MLDRRHAHVVLRPAMRKLCLSVALVLLASCVVDKPDPVETFDGLLVTSKADAPSGYLGSLSYGMTSAPVAYKNPPRFRVFSFEGTAGDAVVVDVRSAKGDAIAWVLDADGNVVGYNDDADSRTLNAHIDTTLVATGTHYIVFRDYWLKKATFTVELQGTPAAPPPPTPVMIDPTVLVGVWEGESFSDSGGAPEPVPPGHYYRFEADGTIAMGCGTNASGTWAIDANGYTLNITLGGGSVQLQWVVIALDAMKLSFVEGGDIFNYKRSACP
jgi:hypothetical protein